MTEERQFPSIYDYEQVDDGGAANSESLVPPKVLPGGVPLEDVQPALFDEHYGEG